MKYKNIRILGVCAAQGAMIFPLKKRLIANVEPRAVFHSKGEPQWKANFGDIPFVRSLDELPEGTKPDFIIGSPSCGHSSVFSYSRKKALGNPKEDPCINLFINSIKKFSPKVFIMENLPKLLDLIPLEEWEKNLNCYRFIVHCHPVSVFGNSQTSRKRLLLIGIDKNLPKEVDKSFKQVFKVNEDGPLTVKKLYTKLNSDQNFREDGDKKLAMYRYYDKSKRTLTVDEVHKLWNGKFKKEFKWPMKGTKMKTLPGVYRNRANAYPLTLRPSNRQFNPEGWPMGLEEYKLIMGFPDKYKIYFNSSDKTYWLNKARNALSKGAVAEIGQWIKLCIKNTAYFNAKN